MNDTVVIYAAVGFNGSSVGYAADMVIESCRKKGQHLEFVKGRDEGDRLRLEFRELECRRRS